MAWTRKKTRRGRTVHLGCYRDPDGRERSRQFDDERTAMRWAEGEEDKSLAGQWVDPATRDITLEEWAPRWLRTKRGLKQKTIHGYQARLGLVPGRGTEGDGRIGRKWNKWRLRDIHRDAINLWVDELDQVEALSGNYIRQHLAILHGVLEEARLHKLVDTNECEGIKAPRARPPAGRWLNADEIDRLAAAFDRIRPGWGVWVLVVAYGGLRWGESVALRRRHVDLPGRRLEVLRAVSEISGVLVEEDAKTQGPVDLPVWVVERLIEWMDEHVGPDPDALVFAAPEGGYLRYPNFRRHKNGFDQAVKDCGWLPRRDGGVTPHVLRHSCATMLIAEGANAQIVKTQMRHSGIAVTYDTYGHLFPGAVADVWARMDENRRQSGVVDLEQHRRARGE